MPLEEITPEPTSILENRSLIVAKLAVQLVLEKLSWDEGSVGKDIYASSLCSSASELTYIKRTIFLVYFSKTMRLMGALNTPNSYLSELSLINIFLIVLFLAFFIVVNLVLEKICIHKGLPCLLRVLRTSRVGSGMRTWCTLVEKSPIDWLLGEF